VVYVSHRRAQVWKADGMALVPDAQYREVCRNARTIDVVQENAYRLLQWQQYFVAHGCGTSILITDEFKVRECCVRARVCVHYDAIVCCVALRAVCHAEVALHRRCCDRACLTSCAVSSGNCCLVRMCDV
jgi:hypothetical protein